MKVLRGKGLDFSVLNSYAGRLKSVICYGEDGKRIFESLRITDKHYVYDLREAVKLQWEKSADHDILLLSPGCTSWDQCADYQERGRIFQETIRRLDAAS
ncbi:MAG: hypothetical protein ACMUJM_17925 [bacterium]